LYPQVTSENCFSKRTNQPGPAVCVKLVVALPGTCDYKRVIRSLPIGLYIPAVNMSDGQRISKWQLRDAAGDRTRTSKMAAPVPDNILYVTSWRCLDTTVPLA
jgi:hypothetical protein